MSCNEINEASVYEYKSYDIKFKMSVCVRLKIEKRGSSVNLGNQLSTATDGQMLFDCSLGALQMFFPVLYFKV